MGSYYDIDTLLTDSQKLPCTFELTVPGLGYLDGNPGQALKSGTKIELPLWLGEMLAVSQNLSSSQEQKPLVTLDMPTALQQRVVNALKADPKSVDLRALATHFYGLGVRMLELFEEEELVDVLGDVCLSSFTGCMHRCETDNEQTFRARAATIADQAHNPRGALGEGADFLRGLDETERQRKWDRISQFVRY